MNSSFLLFIINYPTFLSIPAVFSVYRAQSRSIYVIIPLLLSFLLILRLIKTHQKIRKHPKDQCAYQQ